MVPPWVAWRRGSSLQPDRGSLPQWRQWQHTITRGARIKIAEGLRGVPVLAASSLGDESCSFEEERRLWQELLYLEVPLQVEVSNSHSHMIFVDAAYCDSIFIYQ